MQIQTQINILCLNITSKHEVIFIFHLYDLYSFKRVPEKLVNEFEKLFYKIAYT